MSQQQQQQQQFENSEVLLADHGLGGDGNSIFSTPATILRLSGSPGMALMCWVIGGIISAAGTLVFLEYGTAIPRSGGVKNYLERSFNPPVLQTCIYIFSCIFLRTCDSPRGACFIAHTFLVFGGLTISQRHPPAAPSPSPPISWLPPVSTRQPGFFAEWPSPV